MNSRFASVLQAVPAKGVLAMSVALALAACASAPSFDAPDSGFKGAVNVVETPLVVPGTEVKLAGRDFKAGQEVSLLYDGRALTGSPAVVGADGAFQTQFKLPSTAVAGRHALVVNAAKPSAALVVPLKISPDVPLSGQDRFEVKTNPLVRGLYQSAYSAKTDRVFVTSAVGRSPVAQTELLKINPQTLAIEARVIPSEAPAPRPGAPAADSGQAGSAPAEVGRYAVYGVGVDDVQGTVWVTNTRQGTVAVYSQADLKLIKQFEPGVTPHARDVVIDAELAKAYVTPFGQPEVAVLDTRTLALIKSIPVDTSMVSRGRGQGDAAQFTPISLALDATNHRLYTVSMRSNEAAIIDTRTDKVEQVFALDGALGAIGVAYDAKTNRLLVASQGSDNLLIVDAASGKTLHDVKVGAGSLNVAFDPVHSLAYVSNRAADTLTVVDVDGNIVANLPTGSFPNHTAVDGKGGVFHVNKARGADDPRGDRISYIRPR